MFHHVYVDIKLNTIQFMQQKYNSIGIISHIQQKSKNKLVWIVYALYHEAKSVNCFNPVYMSINSVAMEFIPYHFIIYHQEQKKKRTCFIR